MVIDNFILICVHLSSNSQKNKEQVAKVEKVVTELKNKTPQHEIIIGGDFNSYLVPFSDFYFYPRN